MLYHSLQNWLRNLFLRTDAGTYLAIETSVNYTASSESTSPQTSANSEFLVTNRAMPLDQNLTPLIRSVRCLLAALIFSDLFGITLLLVGGSY